MCFDTFGKAEAHLFEETIPKAGFRFLELQEIFVQDPVEGTYRWAYDVAIQPVEEFVGDFFQGSLTNTPGPTSRCPVQIPVYGITDYACATEAEQVAYMLADYPYHNNYPGYVSGSYPTEPIWQPLLMNPATNIATMLATYRAAHDDPAGRSLMIQVGDNEVRNPIWRRDFHACPEGLYGAYDNPGYPYPEWPVVCYRHLKSNIISRAKKFATCSEEGPNPCKPATGAKEYSEVDFQLGGLKFERYYSSLDEVPLRNGFPSNHWSHSYDARILVNASIPDNVARVDPRGNLHPFRKLSANNFVSRINDAHRLIRDSSGGWIFRGAGQPEYYDASGRLSRLGDGADAVALEYCTGAEYSSGLCDTPEVVDRATDARGRSVVFSYQRATVQASHGREFSATSLLTTISLQGGDTLVTFEYDAYGRLVSASRGTNDVSGYVYGELASICQPSMSPVLDPCNPDDFIYFLTSVTDADGTVRAYTYDASGKALSTSLGLPENSAVLDYPSASSAIALRASGASVQYTFQDSPPFQPLTMV